MPHADVLAAVAVIVTEANKADPPPPEKGVIVESDLDPHKLARLYIAESCQHSDGLKLRIWCDEWRFWYGSAYRVMPEKELCG